MDWRDEHRNQRRAGPPPGRVNKAAELLTYKKKKAKINIGSPFPGLPIFLSLSMDVSCEKSILILVEEEILFRRIVWPYIFYCLIYIAFVFYFLKILYNL